MAILLMGRALVTKSIMSYCQRKAVRICHLFHSKRHLPNCTLLTRQSASVKNGHAIQVAKLIKEDWPRALQ